MDQVYNLKVKQSRQFFNEVLNKYPSFCFSLNAFEDELTAKLGVKECLQHDLLVPYPVMADKAGSFVAVFRTTVMITKGKTTALTGLPVDEAQFKTEHSIKDEQVLSLLSVIYKLFLAIDGEVRTKESQKARVCQDRKLIIVNTLRHYHLLLLFYLIFYMNSSYN